MYLPNELIRAILKDLQRNHLKSARLVCRIWGLLASEFLFDRIYVAPNQVDLEVFNSITQHPTLSKCVRRLIYDGSMFLHGVTKSFYVPTLMKLTEEIVQTGETSLDKSDSQFSEWIADVVERRYSIEELYTKWQNSRLINRGCQTYREHSHYQRTALESGKFVESLVEGLSRLIRLQCVSLEGKWSFAIRTSLKRDPQGTPLARKWNRFQCRPHCWPCDPELSHFNAPTDRVPHYSIITTALVRAQRHIDEFAFGGHNELGICPEVFNVFDGSDITQLTSLGLDIVALSGIKRLHLHLVIPEEDHEHDCSPNIERLFKLLGSVDSIQQLYLDLPHNTFHDDSIFYYHEQVFPQARTWKFLKSLHLTHLVSSANDLIRLLLIQMPCLQTVNMKWVHLLKGCWESVIESLEQNDLDTIYEFVNLTHRDIDFLDCDIADLKMYIIHGGRHPCLSDDEPASASEAYMLEIDPSLRDQLRQMKNHHPSDRTSPPRQRSSSSEPLPRLLP